jgi:hypothetical protein
MMQSAGRRLGWGLVVTLAAAASAGAGDQTRAKAPASEARQGQAAAPIVTAKPWTGHQIESNVHAGVKYIRFMIDQYFANEPMDSVNKALFAFAAYNCGPARVRQLRAEAAREGLDPNVWFDNVEHIAGARIGRETVQYVSNIYKYYIGYQLALQELQEKKALKARVSQ